MRQPVRIPRDYQKALRNFNLDVRRANDWAGTGTGKTGVGLETFDYARMFGEVNRLLVVSTKRVAKLVWPREIDKWENFAHLTCAVAIGTPDQRLAAIRSNALVTTINFENLPWLAETVGDQWPWDMVIADESTRLKNLRIALKTSSTGKQFYQKQESRAKYLAEYAHKKVRYWINGTGTPAPNGLIDLYGQQWYIDAGFRLGRSFTAFQNRWFNYIRTGADAYQAILQPTSWADREIKSLLKDCTMTIEAKDFMDLPPMVKNIIKIPLPPKAYQLYRQMENEMFIELGGQEIEAFNAGAKSMKCRQIASGAVYLQPDDGNDTAPWISLHDEKLDALHDLVNELNGAPLIVVYQFKSDLAKIKKEFPHAVFFDDSIETLNRFSRGEIQILLLHPKSAAHGIDGMQESCNNICIFSQTWDLEDFEQVIERVGPTRQKSSGFDRPCYVHLFVGERTIEEEMLERTETKASVQDSLKQAMKRRG